MRAIVGGRAVLCAALVGVLAASACESQVAGNGELAADARPTARPSPVETGPVTLTVWLYGQLGADSAALLNKYGKEHSNVTVKYERPPDDPEAYWAKLQTVLVPGTGRVDLVSIDVDRMGDLAADPDLWADLGPLGADDLADDYFVSNWAAGRTRSGKVLGLGVDSAPVAMCYRRDLLAAAGMPTDPGELADLWQDWPAYVNSGRTFAAKAGAGVRFADSATTLFRSILGGAETQYYDDSGEPVYDTNPEVRKAWDLAASAVRQGLVNPVRPFSPEWMASVVNGKVATLPCPPWMLGYLQAVGPPNASGKWNVVKAPGPSAWGGSYLSIPGSSRHQQEAYDLAAWLTDPERGTAMFQEHRLFPARHTTAEQPVVADASYPYFSNAPVGSLYTEAARSVPAAPLGPKAELITSTFGSGLDGIRGGTSPDQVWAQTLTQVKNAVDR